MEKHQCALFDLDGVVVNRKGYSIFGGASEL